MQHFKVNGQSVPKIEWKQTDGGLTDGSDCIISHANAVSKYAYCGRLYLSMIAENKLGVGYGNWRRVTNAKFFH